MQFRVSIAVLPETLDGPSPFIAKHVLSTIGDPKVLKMTFSINSFTTNDLGKSV